MDTTLPAHRIETVLQQDGILTLEHLPFQAGQSVEVLILPRAGELHSHNPYPLRGTPVYYERPTDPVAEQDWEAAQ
jgi:hypothetical protein